MLTSLTSAIVSVLVTASTIVPAAGNHVTVEPLQSVGILVYATIIESEPEPEPEPELISLDIKWWYDDDGKLIVTKTRVDPPIIPYFTPR